MNEPKLIRISEAMQERILKLTEYDVDAITDIGHKFKEALQRAEFSIDIHYEPEQDAHTVVLKLEVEPEFQPFVEAVSENYSDLGVNVVVKVKCPNIAIQKAEPLIIAPKIVEAIEG